MLIERGLDPRDFTLCAFGGAGPLHATALMREMGLAGAIVPNHPGQFSALGFTLTDARVDRQRTTQLTSNRFDPARARQIMATLVAEATAELAAQGYTGGIEVQRGLEMRYLGQNYELELPIAEDALADAAIEALWAAFHAAHEARFGFSIPGDIIEIVTYTVTALSRTARPELHRLPPADGPPHAIGERRVLFVTGEATTPVYRRDELRAGHALAGPAIVEESASVTVVEPGQRLTVDPWGHLLIAEG